MPDDKTLKQMLDKWSDGFTPDPRLESKVLALAREEQSRRAKTLVYGGMDVADWLRALFARPALFAGLAAMLVLSGVGISQLASIGLAPSNEELTLSYRLSIDPLYRLQAMAGLEDLEGRRERSGTGAGEEQVLTVGLDWLQSKLKLSDGQYKVVSALHEDYERSFDELFIEMLDSYLKYRHIDQKRMSNDVIDYVQFYELLQKQRRLSEESARLTNELMQKVGDIVSPEQRERYRRLLEQAYPSPNGIDAPAASRKIDA